LSLARVELVEEADAIDAACRFFFAFLGGAFLFHGDAPFGKYREIAAAVSP
jgi:hypothetical protein